MNPDLHFLQINRNAPRSKWRIKNHRHFFYEAVLIISGSEYAKLEDRTINAKVGDLLLFKPGTFHEEWSNSKPSLETIFLAFESANDASFADVPLIIHDTQGRLRLLVQWMLSEKYSLRHNTNTLLAFFHAFIEELKQLSDSDDKHFQLLNLIRKTVINNPTGDYSLEKLAKLAGMSKFHFIRKCKQLYGFTPIKEVQKIRADMAMHLLLTTHDPLKVIAHKTGLGSEISINRLFKKFYGIPPSSLKKNNAGCGYRKLPPSDTSQVHRYAPASQANV